MQKGEKTDMHLELLEYVSHNLPKGFTPYYIYEIRVDDKEVGRVTFREGTFQQHYFDGHIGYHIEPEFRGHHYAYQACLLLQKELGFHQVILTCDPNNQASLHTIEKLGAKYLETKTIPANQRRFFNRDEKEKMIFIWEI